MRRDAAELAVVVCMEPPLVPFVAKPQCLVEKGIWDNQSLIQPAVVRSGASDDEQFVLHCSNLHNDSNNVLKQEKDRWDLDVPEVLNLLWLLLLDVPC